MGKPKIRFEGYSEDWEQRKLGDVAQEFRSGNSLKADEIDITGDYPVYGGNGLRGYTSTYNHDGEYALIGRQGALCGNMNYSVGKAYFTEHAVVVKADENNDTRFLYYMLDTMNLGQYSDQSAQPGLAVNKLVKLENRFPTKEEQQRMGWYFSNIDHLITLHQRKCDEIKTLKKYMLQKMFPQNGEKVPEIRFDGFTEDWEQRKLGEIITEYKETVDSDCTLPILTSSKTEGVILQEEHFGRKQQHDITGYNILPRNYCTYRNRSDGVDFTFNINKCCDKGIISKFYPVFSGKNSDVFFLSLVLNNSDEVVREIAYTCTGTGQKVLSFLDLQKMKVRVPSFDEQKEIAAYFDSLDHLITLHQRKCNELKEIKKYMLQNMFV